jgi:Zn-dependent protease
LDAFGSVILPLVMLIATGGQGPILGWAKPVPINPYNFRDQKWGELKVALAGPATNLLIAVIFGLLIRFLSLPESLLVIFSFISIYNFLLAIFNLIPIPPLDGSHILFNLLPESLSNVKIFLQQYGLFFLLFLIFFGLNWVFYLVQIIFYFIAGKSISI